MYNKTKLVQYRIRIWEWFSKNNIELSKEQHAEIKEIFISGVEEVSEIRKAIYCNMQKQLEQLNKKIRK